MTDSKSNQSDETPKKLSFSTLLIRFDYPEDVNLVDQCIQFPHEDFESWEGTSEMRAYGLGIGTTSPDYSQGTVVTLSDFEMMRTEVTYEMIRGCVEDSVCSSSARVYFGSGIREEMGHPIGFISWFDLQTFAGWVGARLPTESEWEYAARSQGQDIMYPWGNDDPDCTYVDAIINSTQCQGPDSSKVCLTPRGNTAQEICNLGGNVSEWVQDQFYSQITEIPLDGAGACTYARGCPVNASNDTSRPLRGGGYFSPLRLILDVQGFGEL
jgi:formylglycine-generating enzyme required for sulfatase activity